VGGARCGELADESERCASCNALHCVRFEPLVRLSAAPRWANRLYARFRAASAGKARPICRQARLDFGPAAADRKI